MIPRLLFFSLVSLTSLLVLPTDAAAEGRTVQLLTIGNSFSRNATNHLDDLARAAGQTLIDRPIVVGGASLELHATKAQRHKGTKAQRHKGTKPILPATPVSTRTAAA